MFYDSNGKQENTHVWLVVSHSKAQGTPFAGSFSDAMMGHAILIQTNDSILEYYWLISPSLVVISRYHFEPYRRSVFNPKATKLASLVPVHLRYIQFHKYGLHKEVKNHLSLWHSLTCKKLEHPFSKIMINSRSFPGSIIHPKSIENPLKNP